MEIGIVGFRGSGKTTVFNALTGLHAVQRYGDAARPNLGTIKVPDERVAHLSDIFNPKKTTYAEIVFVDVPGRAGKSPSALEPTTVTRMRESDALVQVVRAFPEPVTAAPADPYREIENFKAELILADLAIVEKRLERLRKEKSNERDLGLMERCRGALESEVPLRGLKFLPLEEKALSGFGLLSRVPLLILLNVEEGRMGGNLSEQLRDVPAEENVTVLSLCAQLEMEVAELEPDDRGAFLADLGLTESAADRFIRASYGLLDLISFLTSGSDEVRAWPIRRGTTAVKAAGKIHSDIARGFIRAEVTAYDDFVACGSEAKCREAGKLRLEGKEYVVHDGDIIHFRFNV